MIVFGFFAPRNQNLVTQTLRLNPGNSSRARHGEARGSTEPTAETITAQLKRGAYWISTSEVCVSPNSVLELGDTHTSDVEISLGLRASWAVAVSHCCASSPPSGPHAVHGWF